MPNPVDKDRIREGTAACVAADPLQVICEEHVLQLELCDLLESLADSLPKDLDENLVRVAVSVLGRSWSRHRAIEEECLFPMLRDRALVGSQLRGVLWQLERDHVEDEDRAEEVIYALENYLDDGLIRDPEGLGYLLRGFFQAQRRHTRFENEVVLPAAREALNKSDLAQLQNWILSSGHRRCLERSVVEIREARRCGEVYADCPVNMPSEES